MLKKLEYIDLLRGIAILLVVSVHASSYIWYDNNQHRTEFFDLLFASLFWAGQYGVILFFLVSSITLSISMENRKESNYNFYIRRFFRIAPLYYFGIILYFIFRIAVESHRSEEFILVPNGYTIEKILQNIFFIHGFFPNSYNFVVSGGWSISTEMYFYTIFPILFFFQKKFSLKKFLMISLIICFFAFLIQYFGTAIFGDSFVWRADGRNFNFGYSTIINQISVFLIGIICFKLIKNKFIINNAFLFFGFIFLILSIYYINFPRLHILGLSFSKFLHIDTGFLHIDTGYNGYFFPIFFALGVAPIIIKISNVTHFRNFFLKKIILIGKYSYCIYILHFIVLEILSSILRKTLFKFFEVTHLRFLILFFICVIICFFLSKILNFLIEKPGINLGKKFIKS